MKILVTGGIRSGKSRYALETARKSMAPGLKCFVATAEPLDEEMQARIAKHQIERLGEFATVEEPVYLSKAIDIAAKNSGVVVVDCLTLWVNNLLYHFQDQPERIKHEMRLFLNSVSSAKQEMIFVSNEVGLGLVSENPLSRRYVDELGRLNQELAKLCHEVVFMVAGMPMQVKGEKLARLEH